MDDQPKNSSGSTPQAPSASPPPASPPPSQPALPPPPPPSVPPPSPSPSPPPPSSPTPKPSSPPPPSPSTNPPSPPEKQTPNNAPPPPKLSETSPSPPYTNSSKQSPPTPSQDTHENSPPSPPSQDEPQNSPAPPTTTQPTKSPPTPPSGAFENSPPSTPSNHSSLPRSPPTSLLSPVPPPGEQRSTNNVTLLPPPPKGTSLVLPGSPATTGSNNESGKSQSNGGGIGTIGGVAIGLVIGFVLLGVIGLAVWWISDRKKKVIVFSGLPTSFDFSSRSDSSLLKRSSANVSTGSGQDSDNGTPGLVSSKNWYSYEELARVTNEFSENNLLGTGGFGYVFKGRLPDGREVAVKQLKDGGSQGEREFRSEVETISRVHHRHLVSLVGYCISNEKRLLVYDYVPNNTLEFHLHGKGESVLDWPTRIKIATGAARGIAYLHTDCHPRIVHRDIKSSNILLDNNFEAQVSDFGLARWFSDSNTHVTTRVVGTFGYLSPEYASSGKLTEKSDVFSFGVVLLELLTGRKPVDKSQPLGEESLVEWARPLLNHALDTEEFDELVDPRLENNYVESEMFRVIEAASACVRYSAKKRPKMSQILRALDDMTFSDLSNGMRVGESEIHKSEEMRLFRRMAFGSGDNSTGFFMQDDFRSEEK